jgi:hypothetical protein
MTSVVGLPKLFKALDSAATAYPNALSAAIFQKGLAIIADSVKRTPVDTGRLRASAYASPPDFAGTVEIGYGVTYAVPVHERVEVFHPVGGPLFLKSALDKHRSGYVDWLRKKAGENLRRGVAPGKVRSGLPRSAEEGRSAAEVKAKDV